MATGQKWAEPREPPGDWGASVAVCEAPQAPPAGEAGREARMATGPIRPRRRLLPVTHEAPGSVVGSSGGRGNDLAQRGRADLRRLALDPEALGGGEGDPGSARALDHGRRRPGPRGRANARARPLARGAAARRPRWPAGLRLRRGPAARRTTIGGHPGGGGGADRARGGADRAGDEPAGDADGARGDAQRAGRRGDRADGGGARGRASRSSRCCSWSASTRSRSARSPRPRCASSTSTCTSR